MPEFVIKRSFHAVVVVLVVSSALTFLLDPTPSD